MAVDTELKLPEEPDEVLRDSEDAEKLVEVEGKEEEKETSDKEFSSE